MTSRQEILNHADINRVQLVVGVSLASKVYEAGFPLKVGVVPASDPLKVARCVVGLDAINVVHGGTIEAPPHEGRRDNAMHQEFLPLSAVLHGHGQITVSANPRGEKLRSASLDDGDSATEAGCQSLNARNAPMGRCQQLMAVKLHQSPFFTRSSK